MRRFVNMNKKIQISHAHMFSPRSPEPKVAGRRERPYWGVLCQSRGHAKFVLYYHTDSHGCPRTTRGGLYFHTDNRGCTRTTHG